MQINSRHNWFNNILNLSSHYQQLHYTTAAIIVTKLPAATRNIHCVFLHAQEYTDMYKVATLKCYKILFHTAQATT